MTDGVKIRTILLEDHKMVRQGLVALLQDAPDIEIVAEAGDGGTAVELAKTHVPDVALLDISMPGMNGLEAAQKIREVSPDTKLLFLTMYADDEYIIQALRFGGTGYVLKDADAGTLIDAVRRVYRGESYLSPEVSQTIIRRVINDDSEPHGETHENLTCRERQILQLIAESKTNREIGERLRISIKTVQTHRANLMNKLDIHDQNVAGQVRHPPRPGQAGVGRSNVNSQELTVSSQQLTVDGRHSVFHRPQQRLLQLLYLPLGVLAGIPTVAQAIAFPAGDDVEVHVRHGLPTHLPIVLEHVEARRPGHLHDRPGQLGDPLGDLSHRRRRHVRDPLVVRPGHDQQVRVSQRPDVQERDAGVILVDASGRNGAGDDLAEHAVGLGHGFLS